MDTNPAILYSFRRCPYAMRARMALANSGLIVELREILLRNKPQQLLDISAKGTVPVLLLGNGSVIDESLDIMLWALSKNDPSHWFNNDLIKDINQLIQENDGEFKYYLDRYKYADRYPDHEPLYYRQQAEKFLIDLEQRLSQHKFLCSNNCSLADIAIFPFIRQFANVDSNWFQSSHYQKLKQWLDKHIESALFISIMDKYPAWQAGDKKLVFPAIHL